jgi:hypothetical protein
MASWWRIREKREEGEAGGWRRDKGERGNEKGEEEARTNAAFR